MQFQTDILQCEVVLPKILETTALGAAYLAGLAVGFYKDLDEIKTFHSLSKVYQPKLCKDDCDKVYMGWKRLLKQQESLKWRNKNNV